MIIDRSKQQKNLLEMLQEKNEYISAPCNGNGICGKCIVRYQKRSNRTDRSSDREIFIGKAVGSKAIVWHASHIQPEEYES